MSHVERSDQPTVYEIRVKGTLDVSWSDWFGDLSLVVQEEETMLRGTMTDQGALLGILIKLNDMGLMILTVRRVGCEPEATGRQASHPRAAPGGFDGNDLYR